MFGDDAGTAYRLAEQTKGRVFFTAGKDLDRYVVWDYIDRKREILGYVTDSRLWQCHRRS